MKFFTIIALAGAITTIIGLLLLWLGLALEAM